MKKFITLPLLALAGCATSSEPAYVPPVADLFAVSAAIETPLVSSVGDSADDPAIYIGVNGQGFIAATDKQAGLYIYNLDGTAREFFPLGPLNNVDLRPGFNSGGKDYVVMVASNDEDLNVTVMLYDPATDTFKTPAQPRLTTTPEPYGICLGKVGEEFHVGVTTKAGFLHQYRLRENDGDFSLTSVRDIEIGEQSEGCDFDDRTGKVYVAEEEGGLYVYSSDPSVQPVKTVISFAGEHGIMADLEGVAVYPEGEDGGYVLVSSQGNDSYAAFHLPHYNFAGQFKIAEGAVDAVSVTDGIAVTSRPTPMFPKGFLVVQDNQNSDTETKKSKRQNFKIVDWRDIETGLK